MLECAANCHRNEYVPKRYSYGNRDGGPPLVPVAQLGRENICRLLLEAKAEVNTGLKDGTTALYFACQVGV